MCIWSPTAFYTCEGTVERSKTLCTPHRLPNEAPIAICRDRETRKDCCPHSKTANPEVKRFTYIHKCHTVGPRGGPGRSYGAPQPTKEDREPWTPKIQTSNDCDMFVLDRGGSLKDALLFRWCDGSMATIEQVFGGAGPERNVPGWSGDVVKKGAWQGRDLVPMEEGERRKLLGIGARKKGDLGVLEEWNRFWAEGSPEKSKT